MQSVTKDYIETTSIILEKESEINRLGNYYRLLS